MPLISTFIYIHLCVFLCVCESVCVSVCVCVCVLLTQTLKLKDRKAVLSFLASMTQAVQKQLIKVSRKLRSLVEVPILSGCWVKTCSRLFMPAGVMTPNLAALKRHVCDKSTMPADLC